MTNRHRLVIGAFLLGLTSAYAGIIVMRTNEVLEGPIVETDSLTVTIDLGGNRVKIERSKIQRIEFAPDDPANPDRDAPPPPADISEADVQAAKLEAEAAKAETKRVGFVLGTGTWDRAAAAFNQATADLATGYLQYALEGFQEAKQLFELARKEWVDRYGDGSETTDPDPDPGPGPGPGPEPGPTGPTEADVRAAEAHTLETRGAAEAAGADLSAGDAILSQAQAAFSAGENEDAIAWLEDARSAFAKALNVVTARRIDEALSARLDAFLAGPEIDVAALAAEVEALIAEIRDLKARAGEQADQAEALKRGLMLHSQQLDAQAKPLLEDVRAAYAEALAARTGNFDGAAEVLAQALSGAASEGVPAPLLTPHQESLDAARATVESDPEGAVASVEQATAAVAALREGWASYSAAATAARAELDGAREALPAEAVASVEQTLADADALATAGNFDEATGSLSGVAEMIATNLPGPRDDAAAAAAAAIARLAEAGGETAEPEALVAQADAEADEAAAIALYEQAVALCEKNIAMLQADPIERAELALAEAREAESAAQEAGAAEDRIAAGQVLIQAAETAFEAEDYAMAVTRAGDARDVFAEALAAARETAGQDEARTAAEAALASTQASLDAAVADGVGDDVTAGPNQQLLEARELFADGDFAAAQQGAEAAAAVLAEGLMAWRAASHEAVGLALDARLQKLLAEREAAIAAARAAAENEAKAAEAQTARAALLTAREGLLAWLSEDAERLAALDAAIEAADAEVEAGAFDSAAEAFRAELQGLNGAVAAVGDETRALREERAASHPDRAAELAEGDAVVATGDELLAAGDLAGALSEYQTARQWFEAWPPVVEPMVTEAEATEALAAAESERTRVVSQGVAEAALADADAELEAARAASADGRFEEAVALAGSAVAGFNAALAAMATEENAEELAAAQLAEADSLRALLVDRGFADDELAEADTLVANARSAQQAGDFVAAASSAGAAVSLLEGWVVASSEEVLAEKQAWADEARRAAMDARALAETEGATQDELAEADAMLTKGHQSFGQDMFDEAHMLFTEAAAAFTAVAEGQAAIRAELLAQIDERNADRAEAQAQAREAALSEARQAEAQSVADAEAAIVEGLKARVEALHAEVDDAMQMAEAEGASTYAPELWASAENAKAAAMVSEGAGAFEDAVAGLEQARDAFKAATDRAIAALAELREALVAAAEKAAMAEQNARAAGAEELAAASFEAGLGSMEEARTAESAGDFTAAELAYGAAVGAFAQAAEEAKIAAAEGGEATALAAKAKADAARQAAEEANVAGVNPDGWAAALQALEAAQVQLGDQDYEGATAGFEGVAETFRLLTTDAVELTAQLGTARDAAVAAEARAEAAEAARWAEDVMIDARSKRGEAELLSEEGRVADAVAAFGAATALFDEATGLAAKAQATDALAAANAARAAALEAGVPEDQADFVSGQEALDKATSQFADEGYEAVTLLAADARAAFEKARTAAMSAEEQLRNEAIQAQTSARAAREAAQTAQAEQRAAEDFAAATTALDEGQAALSADDFAAATAAFQRAEALFTTAAENAAGASDVVAAIEAQLTALDAERAELFATAEELGATDSLAEGDKLLTDARAALASSDHALAESHVAAAKAAFAAVREHLSTLSASETLAQARGAAETARQAADAARATAQQADAERWASDELRAARDKYSQADAKFADEEYKQAENLFAAAASGFTATAQAAVAAKAEHDAAVAGLRQEVTASRVAAEEARTQAQAEGASEHATALFEGAARAFAEAQQHEQREDWEAAKVAFNRARDGYANALTTALEVKAEAEAAMARARASLDTALARMDDEKKLAAEQRGLALKADSHAKASLVENANAQFESGGFLEADARKVVATVQAAQAATSAASEARKAFKQAADLYAQAITDGRAEWEAAQRASMVAMVAEAETAGLVASTKVGEREISHPEGWQVSQRDGVATFSHSGEIDGFNPNFTVTTIETRGVAMEDLNKKVQDKLKAREDYTFTSSVADTEIVPGKTCHVIRGTLTKDGSRLAHALVLVPDGGELHLFGFTATEDVHNQLNDKLFRRFIQKAQEQAAN